MLHIPDAYKPENPMGLVVILNYKDSTVLPVPVLASCDARNLAMIVPKSSGQQWWVKCGLALDMVGNMRQLYKIDPNRIYVLGFDYDADAIRLRSSVL